MLLDFHFEVLHKQKMGYEFFYIERLKIYFVLSILTTNSSTRNTVFVYETRKTTPRPPMWMDFGLSQKY